MVLNLLLKQTSEWTLQYLHNLMRFSTNKAIQTDQQVQKKNTGNNTNTHVSYSITRCLGLQYKMCATEMNTRVNPELWGYHF